MKLMKTMAALGGIMLAGAALAADLPSRKAPAPYIAPPPVFTWTGFYIGLNAGADFRVNNNNNNNSFNNALIAAQLGLPFFPTNGSGRSVNFVGGGQAGYNFQTGPVVFGLEVDAQYRGFLNSNNSSFFGGGGSNNSGGFFGTGRGRLGYAFTPAFMIYATGGVAFGNVANSNGFNPFLVGFGNNNNNNFRVGYTVGGGAEYMFTPNWSIKGEFLYVDLGRGNNSNNSFFGTGGGSRAQFGIARLGVNYHFNTFEPGPVVARY